MSLPLPTLNHLLSTASRRVEIVDIAQKGRGVVARSRFAPGHVVLASSEPLCCSSSPIGSITPLPWALPPEEAQWGSAAILSARSCFEREACRVIEAVADGTFRQFPIMAAQIAARLLCEPAGSASRYGVVLAALCQPRIEYIPDAWLVDHQNLLAALTQAAHSCRAEWCTPAWYAGVIGRMHLNAIADGKALTALYALPSFLNHARYPTLLARFADDGGPTVSFLAARPLEPGDELTISYLDESLSHQPARNDYLLQHYGFVEEEDNHLHGKTFESDSVEKSPLQHSLFQPRRHSRRNSKRRNRGR